MRLRLSGLQEIDPGAKKSRKNLPEDSKDVKDILHHQSLLYFLEIICSKILSCYYNRPLGGYFKIEKTKKLVDIKYL